MRQFPAIAGFFLLLTLWSFPEAPAGEAVPFRLLGGFSDHMVLQHDREIELRGTAEPGKTVRVFWRDGQYSAAADPDGNWSVKFNSGAVDASGLRLRAECGGKKTELNDVLIGEVWLCVGQSNMRFELKRAKGGAESLPREGEEISSLRLLKIPMNWAGAPQKSVRGRWRVCTGKNASDFSAVGFFFGREMTKRLGVPVGIIAIAYAGSTLEAWLDRETLLGNDALFGTSAEGLRRLDAEGKYRKDVQRIPSVLYNGMASGLAGQRVAGMIYYQGEDNHRDGALFAGKLGALAQCWKKLFRDPELPVYTVLLPPYRYDRENDTQLPELWAAQRRFAASSAEFGCVPAYDLGMADDIHPPDKYPIARRLAELTLRKHYRKNDAWMPPPEVVDVRASASGGAAAVRFSRPVKPASPGDGIAGFEIAGKDGIFFPAAGRLTSGDTVELTAEKVKSPEQVRYLWHDLPPPGLVDENGVPAFGFEAKKVEKNH